MLLQNPIRTLKACAGFRPERAQSRLLQSKFGPEPKDVLRAMLDYGLTAEDIARYFAVSTASTRRLIRHFKIASA